MSKQKSTAILMNNGIAHAQIEKHLNFYIASNTSDTYLNFDFIFIEGRFWYTIIFGMLQWITRTRGQVIVTGQWRTALVFKTLSYLNFHTTCTIISNSDTIPNSLGRYLNHPLSPSNF